MTHHLAWVLFVAGLWLISLALITKTGNFFSSFVFKIVPFFIGLACLFNWFIVIYPLSK
jgi:hypothetical protein